MLTLIAAIIIDNIVIPAETCGLELDKTMNIGMAVSSEGGELRFNDLI